MCGSLWLGQPEHGHGQPQWLARGRKELSLGRTELGECLCPERKFLLGKSQFLPEGRLLRKEGGQPEKEEMRVKEVEGEGGD